ncbi:MAG: hypothetical protein PHU79_05985 [Oscillospiraceae bacterium]|nr:hypothetical protein [Oscillospiraceae bacterium]
MKITEFETCLLQQAALHPALQPQDTVKLCYQAAFGGEHLLKDLPAAETYFRQEFSVVPKSKEVLFEPLSADVCRINLAAWKAHALPPEWLFQIFRCSSVSHPKAETLFEQNLSAAKALAAAGNLPFSPADFEQYLKQYRAAGPCRPIHHSEIYRQAEHPAYRVAGRPFVRLFPLLEKIAALPPKTGAQVITLDGRSASGKTTAAAQLESVICAAAIHMDDFFLPPSLRTEKRFAEPGGNVHYERFCQEVLPHLGKDSAFSYQIFDCGKMALSGMRQVPKSHWQIVEGAYSCHPALGKYADLRAFSDIDPQKQLQRICRRNGAESAKVFASRWIPLEERYFSAFHIREAADIVF